LSGNPHGISIGAVTPGNNPGEKIKMATRLVERGKGILFVLLSGP
jgi:hypothetical protein